MPFSQPSTTTDFACVTAAPPISPRPKPACRDYVAAYVRAFRRAGFKVGLYFSTADWSQPAYFEGPRRDPRAFRAFIDYTHAQIRELCSAYGKIDIFWFDGVWPYTAREWRARDITALIRRLQPGVILNDRIGLAGDIATPEQHIPEQQFRPALPWEACLTSTEKWWGYHAGVQWKTDAEAIRELCRVVEVGGNLVYNVGPKPDGSMPREFKALMARIGAWMRRNSAAIYGAAPTLCDTTTFGLMTVKGQRIFLHVLHWPGRELCLAGLRNRVRAARFLATGRPLAFRQTATHVFLSGLPARPPDPRNTVIVLDVVGAPASHPWAAERLWTGAAEKTPAHSQRVAARLGPWSRS